jgi:hypothetical protein
MGYSCALAADVVLDELSLIIQRKIEATGVKAPTNRLPGGGFWEIGRENADGSITGTCWKPWKPDPSKVVRGGSFKIAADGRIVRFPGVSVELKALAEAAARARLMGIDERSRLVSEGN